MRVILNFLQILQSYRTSDISSAIIQHCTHQSGIIFQILKLQWRTDCINRNISFYTLYSYTHTRTHAPIHYSDLDEDVDVMVTIQISMQEVPDSKLGRGIYHEDCRNYPQQPRGKFPGSISKRSWPYLSNEVSFHYSSSSSYFIGNCTIYATERVLLNNLRINPDSIFHISIYCIITYITLTLLFFCFR
jgi:hypothetical protein